MVSASWTELLVSRNFSGAYDWFLLSQIFVLTGSPIATGKQVAMFQRATLSPRMVRQLRPVFRVDGGTKPFCAGDPSPRRRFAAFRPGFLECQPPGKRLVRSARRKITHAEHGFTWYMYAMAKCQWRYICMTVLWPLLIASDGMAENADIHQSSLGLGHS